VSFRVSYVYSSSAAAGFASSAAFILRFRGFPRVFGSFQHWFFFQLCTADAVLLLFQPCYNAAVFVSFAISWLRDCFVLVVQFIFISLAEAVVWFQCVSPIYGARCFVFHLLLALCV